MLDFLLICHNNADYFVYIFPKILQSIKILEPNFYIYENNSTDNTKHILTHYQKKIPNFYGRPLQTDVFDSHVLVSHFVQSTSVDVALSGFYEIIRGTGGRNIDPIFF